MADYEGIGFLIKAGKQRLKDAQVLLETTKPGRERGAVYVCGYSVECLLKALLVAYSPGGLNTLSAATRAYRKGNPAFPSVTTKKGHDIRLLVELCEKDAGVTFTSSERKHFGTLMKWSHTWRYLAEKPRPGFAAQFVDAASNVVKSLETRC